jgi:hypothetical protein
MTLIKKMGTTVAIKIEESIRGFLNILSVLACLLSTWR